MAGEDSKTYYLGRLGFFHYSAELKNLGYLQLKSFILIEENAKLAIAKLKRIMESEKDYYAKTNQSYYPESDKQVDGIDVLTDCVGIVNFEQMEEKLRKN